MQHSQIEIVKGDCVKGSLPWLYSLYASQLRRLAEIASGYKLAVASDVTSAINVNRLKGIGANYEWHTDSNHVTGMLYVDTLARLDGGLLTFDLGARKESFIPRSGTFLAFDARTIPHTVEPLTVMRERTSVPMNYYIQGMPQTRPVGLDAYLYSEVEDR